MIEIRRVSWTYPHADAPSLRELELSIAPGEFVVLCGASGSGKSTALRLINGLVPHVHEDGTLHGGVQVDGLVPAQVALEEIGLRTGSVLQHPRRQFFATTVAEEIAFAMENFGAPAARIRARVGAALVDLAGAMDVGLPLARLSGGQQQRVAIAAATAHEPGIVLLDEPSSNLSADAVEHLTAVLAQLKERGSTVVVAEHRLRYLEDLADRVVVMHEGSIDARWSAEQFRSIGDDELARRGLRGRVRSAQRPVLPAAGAGVRGPVDREQVPTGALELRGLRCRRGGRTVLDLERVAFPAGSVTAVRGANGAGKSTVARVIAGLQRAAGEVVLDGRPLRMRDRQRVSAIAMQDVQRQLFTESVRAEVELAAGERRSGAGPEEVLEELDLAQLASRHPLSLSGGQQQRLVVGAVRLAGRCIVIFDEPSSGVDRRHLRSVSDQIRQVAAGGAVVLLISHDDDLLTLAADHQITLVPPESPR